MGQQQIMGTPNSRLQQYQQYIDTREHANSNQMHAHQDLAFVNHGLDQMHIQDNNNNHMMSKLRDSIMAKLKPKEREVTERLVEGVCGLFKAWYSLHDTIGFSGCKVLWEEAPPSALFGEIVLA